MLLLHLFFKLSNYSIILTYPHVPVAHCLYLESLHASNRHDINCFSYSKASQQWHVPFSCGCGSWKADSVFTEKPKRDVHAKQCKCKKYCLNRVFSGGGFLCKYLKQSNSTPKKLEVNQHHSDSESNEIWFLFFNQSVWGGHWGCKPARSILVFTVRHMRQQPLAVRIQATLPTSRQNLINNHD